MNRNFGKINMIGMLVYAKNILEDEDGSIILNPTRDDFIRHGYFEITDNGVPEELKGKIIEKYYETEGTNIIAKYRESVMEEQPSGE